MTFTAAEVTTEAVTITVAEATPPSSRNVENFVKPTTPSTAR